MMNWKQAALGTFGAIVLLTTAACGEQQSRGQHTRREDGNRYYGER
ncbi:hypothetical protein P9222_07040 [Paenibacillus amylolyticus]|nr:hypothetical protein [Paenibacillus amylolyticus]WFR63969.1 hypothetical protein P9222_07040 [Paenibacillus amylolyticus]